MVQPEPAGLQAQQRVGCRPLRLLPHQRLHTQEGGPGQYAHPTYTLQRQEEVFPGVCFVYYKNYGSRLSQTVLRIRDAYPGSRILIFIHPGSRIQQQQQKRRVKKFVFLPIFVATKVPKMIFFNRKRQKFESIYKEL